MPGGGRDDLKFSCKYQSSENWVENSSKGTTSLSSWLLGYLNSPCQGGSREQKPLKGRLMLPWQQNLMKRCEVQEWYVIQQLLYACRQATRAPGTPR